jgi:predicted nucleotidyltransferase
LVYTQIRAGVACIRRNIVSLKRKKTGIKMLSQSQIDIIIDSMTPYNPVRIGIFGSVARGEDTDDSDIDVLYQLKSPVGLFNLVRMKDDLEQKLNRKVDLVSERFVHHKLKSCIMNDLKIIYDNER